jgi:acetyl-CoA acetyltransferase
MPNRRVAIVGASTSDCGRVDDKTAFQLNFQGTTRALADAGIDKSEVDGFMAATGTLPPVELAEYLGLRPNWVDSTSHGGSVWEFMVEHAAAAISQGLVEVVVLTYGSTARADLKKKLRMANLSFGVGRGRGVDPLQRRIQSRGLLPRTHHHRRRGRRADGVGPPHQVALLHPLGRGWRYRADERGAGSRLRTGARLGARER